MLKILKFSHHFALESPQEVYRRAIDDFARTYLLQITFYKLFNHKVVQRTDKMFAVRSKNPLVYRFHINIMDKFLDYMRSRGFNNFDIKEEPMYEPAKAEFKLVTDKRPWGMQPEIIEYLVSPGKKKVVEMQAGSGKTLCTLFAVHGIGERVLLTIKPMYIQRWLDDLTKDTGIFKLKKDEIVVVKGGQALASVIKMALDNKLTYKFIVVSNKTLYNYYKDFTEGVNMEKYFNVKPFELFKVLKVGVRIIDEAHQDFHQCFKTDLFSHVPKTIELSATLTPDSPFLKNMYEIMYPLEDRLGGGVYNKYVNVFSVPYRLDKSNNQSVRVNQRGMLSYSHGSLEESIMKDKKRLENYLDMILDLTENYFIKKRYADFKLLIFAGRVELCKIIVEKLQPLYSKLKITKYTEEEDYSILADMDIIVSTPISSGTAVDIPRLQVCINTVAIGSTQANLQMIGRLRELRGVDIKPTFLYLYCVDIAKHVEYHVKKRNHTFKDRVLSYTDLVPIKYTV